MTAKKKRTLFKGSKVKELREGLGLSLYAFGLPLGKHSTQIEKWERGDVEPSIRSLTAMVDRYGKPVEYFFS